MDLKDTYNKIAEDWFKEIDKNHWWIKGLHAFLDLLKPGSRILDVGCGPGLTAKAFVGHGFTITGIDFADRMIEIAQREVPAGTFLVMDVADIEKLPGQFDGVFMQNVLLHIQKKEAQNILLKVAAKVKEGGYFYLSVAEKKANGPEEEIKVNNDYGYEYKRFFSYFTQEEVKNYMNQLEFQTVFFHVVPMWNKNWIQIIGKK